MILNLLSKEFFSSSLFKQKGMKFYTSLLASLLVAVFFLWIECYLYSKLYDKLNVYTNFNASFFKILIFIYFILITLFSLPLMYSTFFKGDRERIILGTRPVSRTDIIIAKSIYSYLRIVLFSFLTYIPIAIVYGIKNNSSFFFYFGMIFYSFFLSLIALSFALLLLIPLKEIYTRLKNHKWILFIIVIIISFLLAYFYSVVLNLFITLVRGSSLDLLFTSERMAMLTNISTKLIPISNIVNFSFYRDMPLNFLVIFSVTLAALVISYLPFNFYYKHYLKNNSLSAKSKVLFKPVIRLHTPFSSLIKKELFLAFNNQDGLFSYISLILVEPFLIYLVVSSTNLIFQTGNLNYINKLFPMVFEAIDSLLILLFLAVINSSSSVSLKIEDKTIYLLKSMPVTYKKQFFVKLLVPFILSSVSYLVALIVLVSTKVIAPLTFLYLIFIGLVTLLVLNLTNLYSELKLKKGSSLVSLFTDFLLPIIFVLLASALTFIPAIKALGATLVSFIFYLIIFILLVITLIPILIYLNKNISKLFFDYEGGRP